MDPGTTSASLPTVSDPRAMADFAEVRALEREALLDLIPLAPGMSVLDVQAAGGFLSDGVFERLGGDVTCVCVEPCDALRARLRPEFVALADRVEDFVSIQTASLDAALGLVALHHSADHQATVNEVHRVLRPGAWFGLCEVMAESPAATWLNGFVNTHSVAGHDGRFPPPGALQLYLETAGFVDVHEAPRHVPWRFARRDDVTTFFQLLFGLTCSRDDVLRAVLDHFYVSETADGIEVDWRLQYVRGRVSP